MALLLLLTSVLAAWDGNTYRQNSSVQKSHAQQMFDRLQLRGDEKILDVGCGTGEITFQLAERVPQGQVVGLDPSASMLSAAEKLAPLPNLRFIQGAAETFQSDIRFDYVISLYTLHWIQEQQKALDNIVRHMTPGGRVYFILSPSKEGLPFHTALQKTMGQWNSDFQGFVSNQQVYDLETYRKHLVRAGLHIDEIRYTRYARQFASADELARWLAQWLPHYKSRPAEKKEAFLAHLVANYLQETGYPAGHQGMVGWVEYALTVEATK